jgi:hypothetical protein
MKFQSFRSAIVFASVIASSALQSQAFAQIDVLSGAVHTSHMFYGATSTYKFTDSMILNSIGFYTNGKTPQSLSYSVHGSTYALGTDFSLAQLSGVENGIQWLSITPQSMLNNDIVTVSTTGSLVSDGDGGFNLQTDLFNNFTVNANANVTYVGLMSGGFSNVIQTGYTTSNIRVSNPGSNVAPEPGTLALAVTGGFALVGMRIRRRRMSN